MKSAWTIGEGDPLTNLEASAREAGTIWDAPWGLRHWWEPFFVISGYLANTGIGGHHFVNLHLTC